MNIQEFWQAVLEQNPEKIRSFFLENAYVNWHCTNEHFNLEEYIRANCEYPGEWDGEVERIESFGNLIVTATNVYTTDKTLSFHVVSFFTISEGKIAELDEYWGDDGEAPQWRLDKRIGSAIKEGNVQ
ncbi:nuclear transport factor 2 family protein [Konateibacter massiliensis]|uniref:nuclear transport factor 2 family protein n=1 Tax=Konateibacter massiliensis TaxID=2002841 RepID=UPI000C14CA03|nr:nuclear transport factor 2 family protein [Konateibacter massiliensis]